MERPPFKHAYSSEMGEVSGPPSTAGYYDHPSNAAAVALDRGRAAAARSRRRWIWALSLLLLAVVIAVAVGVGVTQSRKSSRVATSSGSTDSVSSSEPSPTPTVSSSSASAASPSVSSFPTSGKDGSLVLLSNGSLVTYSNPFGGDWQLDPASPSGPGGRAQSWTKRVGGGDEFVMGRDRFWGVNLGGWLALEPFISPAIFEKWHTRDPTVVDEWTLSLAMGAQLETEMKDHYDTFITEMDFMEIAAAGLGWIRLPIGFWAVGTLPGEPQLANLSWSYVLKAIGWARKYGLRMILDLHALPGSQNGWNHSGKAGSVNFLAGTMGLANAERTLDILKTLAIFIAQPEYKDVVPVLSIVNEILLPNIGLEQTMAFYLEALITIREATGSGAGKGPWIAVHDGFQSPSGWTAWLPGADRLILDNHSYLSFNPALYTQTLAQLVNTPCGWAPGVNASLSQTGMTIGGEYSAASNDCGYWLNGILPDGGSSFSFPASTCGVVGADSYWDNYRAWTPERIQLVKNLAMNSMDALSSGGSTFWTWKIGVSSVLGYAGCPDWHYRLGLEQGWIPKDPREILGRCAAQVGSTPFDGNFPFPEASGGTGAGIPAATRAAMPWPPASIMSISVPMTQLPHYTPTGAPVILSLETMVAASTTVALGSGPTNTQRAVVPISGCAYPNAWDAGPTLPAGYIASACATGVAAA